MKPEAELVIAGANQLLTLQAKNPAEPEEKLGIVPDGTVAVGDGRILWAGPEAQVAEHVTLSSKTKKLDAAGKIVMPGLIDAHTHLLFAGSREREFELRIKGATYQEIAAHGGGIKSTVEMTRRADPETLFRIGKKHLDSLLSLGTTTVEAKSGYGLAARDELKMLEVLRDLNREHAVDVVPTFLGAHEIPPEYAGKKEDYVRLVIEEMIPAVGEAKLAAFCDVFCEEGVFSLEDSRRILEAGKRWGLLPKIHADELTPLGGAELAAEVDAVSADHLLFVTEAGVKAMAAKGVVAVLLPGTAFFLFMNRYAPARKLVEGGVTVALASDFNPGSCMTESLPLITTIACTQMRLSPAESILGVTLHAARALRREDQIGSLAPGKEADMVILDIPDYRHFSYHFGVNHVWKVIKKGRIAWERRDCRRAKTKKHQPQRPQRKNASQ